MLILMLMMPAVLLGVLLGLERVERWLGPVGSRVIPRR